jgi:hypothetical protein
LIPPAANRSRHLRTVVSVVDTRSATAATGRRSSASSRMIRARSTTDCGLEGLLMILVRRFLRR